MIKDIILGIHNICLVAFGIVGILFCIYVIIYSTIDIYFNNLITIMNKFKLSSILGISVSVLGIITFLLKLIYIMIL